MNAVVFIPLTQGKVAVIDFDDFEKVRGFKWHAYKGRRTWYGRSNLKGPGNKQISMHRLLLSVGPKDEVDHKDGDGLNNQRSNIRICSTTQNQQSRRRKMVGASSQYRGVTRHSQNSNWKAQITTAGKNIHLGSFTNEKNAARAYDKKALELFGEFASLNFPT